MDIFLEILKITLPALLVFLTAWVTMRSFLKKEQKSLDIMLIKHSQEKRAALLKESRKTIMPLRLQAYERLTIFCNRLELGATISRTPASQNMSAHLYKKVLQATIQEEFEHNITQQIYMTDDLWNIVTIAEKEAVAIIEKIYNGLESTDCTAKDFLEALVVYMTDHQQMGYIQAILAIKKEVSFLFD